VESDMETIKVLAKGQIVIPASMRKKYGIAPGDKITIFEYDNLIYLSPLSKAPVKEAMGCLPKTPSLSEELLEERRKDFAE
jgi:AbrB family looped-hinge helix DNA binding protein